MYLFTNYRNYRNITKNTNIKNGKQVNKNILATSIKNGKQENKNTTSNTIPILLKKYTIKQRTFAFKNMNQIVTLPYKRQGKAGELVGKSSVSLV